LLLCSVKKRKLDFVILTFLVVILRRKWFWLNANNGTWKPLFSIFHLKMRSLKRTYVLFFKTIWNYILSENKIRHFLTPSRTLVQIHSFSMITQLNVEQQCLPNQSKRAQEKHGSQVSFQSPPSLTMLLYIPTVILFVCT